MLYTFIKQQEQINWQSLFLFLKGWMKTVVQGLSTDYFLCGSVIDGITCRWKSCNRVEKKKKKKHQKMFGSFHAEYFCNILRVGAMNVCKF